MFKNVAAVYDDSPEAARALHAAIDLAKLVGAGLQVITVIEDLPVYTAYAAAVDESIGRTLMDDRMAYCDNLQPTIRNTASRAGVAVRSELSSGDKIDAIIAFVKAHQIDVLVVGLHHNSLRVSRLWSAVYTLAQELPCSILGVH